MGIGRRFVSTPVNAYQTLANCLFLKKVDYIEFKS